MNKTLKKPISLILIGVFVAIVLVFSLLSLNTFKGYISDHVKENYKLSLIFTKSIHHSLFFPGKVKFRGVKLYLEHKKSVELDELSINMKIMSLFSENLIIDLIAFKGVFLDLNNSDILKIKENIQSANKRDPQSTKSKSLSFILKSLMIDGMSLNFGDLHIKNILLRSSANSKAMDISDLQLDLFGGHFSSQGKIIYGKGPLNVELKGKYEDIPLKTWNYLLEKKKITMNGQLLLDYDINWQQNKPKSPTGTVHLTGEKLDFKGVDIDQLLAGFIDSREVGLLDVAGFLTMGPLGALLTNTLEAGKSVPGLGSGESEITKLNMKTTLREGMVHMDDVAFSTKENRLAFKGKLNLLSHQFDNFFVHILDEKACTKILQQVSGPLNKPDIGVTQTMSAGIISPATDLFKKTKDLLGCKPTYSGVVAHPE